MKPEEIEKAIVGSLSEKNRPVDERGLATNRSSPAPLSEHGIGLDKQEVHPDNAHCSMARHPVQEVDLHSIGYCMSGVGRVCLIWFNEAE